MDISGLNEPLLKKAMELEKTLSAGTIINEALVEYVRVREQQKILQIFDSFKVDKQLLDL